MEIHKRECFLTTTKYQNFYESAICSSDKGEQEFWN